jgi:hypothetical protein
LVGGASRAAAGDPDPPHAVGRLAHRPASRPLLPAAWLRPKQTDLVPGKRQFRSRFPPIRLSYGCPTTIFWIPATDTDIISAQHFWTGGLETAGPGCYDAVAIARTAVFRMLVMSPHPSCGDCPLTARSRPKRAAKISRKNRCRTTIAERMGENTSGTALWPGSGCLLKPQPGRPQRAEEGGADQIGRPGDEPIDHRARSAGHR